MSREQLLLLVIMSACVLNSGLTMARLWSNAVKARRHATPFPIVSSVSITATNPTVPVTSGPETTPSDSHRPDIRSGTLYAIITLPVYAHHNRERLNNVKQITTEWPEITVFDASHYLDAGCLSILKRMNITVSPQYKSWEGVGWVHAGKIGHWCSFLRFATFCDNAEAEFCVWLEDDIRMTASLFRIIRSHVKEYGTPLVALGKGDEVNVLVGRHMQQLLRHFTNYTIVSPLDVTPDNRMLRTSLYLFDARRYHGAETSTLVCKTCPLLSVAEVNSHIKHAKL